MHDKKFELNPGLQGDGVFGVKIEGDGVREVGGTVFYAKNGKRGDGVRNLLNATLTESSPRKWITEIIIII